MNLLSNELSPVNNSVLLLQSETEKAQIRGQITNSLFISHVIIVTSILSLNVLNIIPK
jgi:hypothetical protein